jgi:dihydrofolate reductase
LSNTELLKGDLATEVRNLKKEPGPDMVILGSGSIVSQLAQENLIDEYQLALSPIVLGKGRTLFESVKEKINLKLTSSRTFGNGTVFACYQPAA